MICCPSIPVSVGRVLGRQYLVEGQKAKRQVLLEWARSCVVMAAEVTFVLRRDALGPDGRRGGGNAAAGTMNKSWVKFAEESTVISKVSLLEIPVELDFVLLEWARSCVVMAAEVTFVLRRDALGPDGRRGGGNAAAGTMNKSWVKFAEESTVISKVSLLEIPVELDFDRVRGGGEALYPQCGSRSQLLLPIIAYSLSVGVRKDTGQRPPGKHNAELANLSKVSERTSSPNPRTRNVSSQPPPHMHSPSAPKRTPPKDTLEKHDAEHANLSKASERTGLPNHPQRQNNVSLNADIALLKELYLTYATKLLKVKNFVTHICRPEDIEGHLPSGLVKRVYTDDAWKREMGKLKKHLHERMLTIALVDKLMGDPRQSRPEYPVRVSSANDELDREKRMAQWEVFVNEDAFQANGKRVGGNAAPAQMNKAWEDFTRDPTWRDLIKDLPIPVERGFGAGKHTSKREPRLVSVDLDSCDDLNTDILTTSASPRNLEPVCSGELKPSISKSRKKRTLAKDMTVEELEMKRLRTKGLSGANVLEVTRIGLRWWGLLLLLLLAWASLGGLWVSAAAANYVWNNTREQSQLRRFIKEIIPHDTPLCSRALRLGTDSMKNEEDWYKLIMAGGELVLEIVLAGYCTENDATGDSPWKTIIGQSISSL
ncbi:uncharacterized protein PAC_04326 [Phialocephala subalpina]|uniref:Uncharacterized protein n=1 Tax=Phialocephala subalpina TaxID=576137 RepID=A0A1L7WNU2_9HELO|nr:uncharacterized protein PAC_04326 [Phialocephala subalpina]